MIIETNTSFGYYQETNGVIKKAQMKYKCNTKRW